MSSKRVKKHGKPNCDNYRVTGQDDSYTSGPLTGTEKELIRGTIEIILWKILIGEIEMGHLLRWPCDSGRRF